MKAGTVMVFSSAVFLFMFLQAGIGLFVPEFPDGGTWQCGLGKIAMVLITVDILVIGGIGAGQIKGRYRTKRAGEKGKEEFQYIIGSGSPQKLKEYLLCIRDIVAPDISLGIGELDYNGLEMDIDILGNKVLAKELGFEPKVSFEEGIKRTLAWIKNEG